MLNVALKINIHSTVTVAPTAVCRLQTSIYAHIKNYRHFSLFWQEKVTKPKTFLGPRFIEPTKTVYGQHNSNFYWFYKALMTPLNTHQEGWECELKTAYPVQVSITYRGETVEWSLS